MNSGQMTNHPALWTGYGLIMLALIAMPIIYVTEAVQISSFRTGAADRFTTVMAYVALVIAFYLTFQLRTIEAIITPQAIMNTINGIMIEGAGLAIQGAYWVPWYIAKENGNQDVVTFLNSNTWIITPAYGLMWLGIGLTMNVGMRTLMGDKYPYWPLGWFMFIVSCWVVGYQLPDFIG